MQTNVTLADKKYRKRKTPVGRCWKTDEQFSIQGLVAIVGNKEDEEERKKYLVISNKGALFRISIVFFWKEVESGHWLEVESGDEYEAMMTVVLDFLKTEQQKMIDLVQHLENQIAENRGAIDSIKNLSGSSKNY